MKSHYAPWNHVKSHEIPLNSHGWLTTPKSYRSPLPAPLKKVVGLKQLPAMSSHPDPEQGPWGNQQK
jgi:hypothetical protein